MFIHLQAPPQKPTWPQGFTITNLAQTPRLEDGFRVASSSFSDHRGAVNESFEVMYARFLHFLETDTHYDPALYFMVLDGDKIAGVSFTRPQSWDDPDEAYVKTLGVLPEYRQKGLGLALLLHTFNEYWARGQAKISLHVDGASITGATRLYEKAGMQVTRAYNAYEKELRPGRELSAQ